VVYRNVDLDREAMAEMLGLSQGRRDVPLIRDGDTVTIGYGGS
jgi:hypothetical protein